MQQRRARNRAPIESGCRQFAVRLAQNDVGGAGNVVNADIVRNGLLGRTFGSGPRHRSAQREVVSRRVDENHTGWALATCFDTLDKVAYRQHVLVDAAKFRIFESWNPGSARLWPSARLHNGQHARARDEHMHAVEYAPPLNHIESVQEERFEVATRLRLTGR